MSDNIQKKISRNRPPRVQITYDLELEGAQIKKELPCVIGLIANLTGEIDENNAIPIYSQRKFVLIDQDNVDDVFAKSKPMAKANLGLDLEKQSSCLINFKTIKDLHPEYIMKNIPIMNERYEKRLKLSDLLTRILNNEKMLEIAELLVKDNKSKPEDLFKDYPFINEEQKTYILDIFSLLSEIQNEQNNVILKIQDVITIYDQELTILLNQFLHSKSYKDLESSWLGIRYMLNNLELGESLKIRVLNATFKEINEDLVRALAFDQSFLFKKLYEEEYGTYGGEAYTCLLVDKLIEKNQEDFFFLHKFAEVVCAAHIPTAIGVHSNMFDLSDYTSLHKPRMLDKIFQSPEFKKFKSFRAKDESRYISLIMPSFMSRIPYGPKTEKIETMDFTEDVSKHEYFSWSNSVYVYGTKIAQSFSKFHWFSSIIGPENGGKVDDLPAYSFQSEDGDIVFQSPSETAITDRREKELSSLGFISLCHCKDSDFAVFFSGQSANDPPLYNKDIANANAKLSARFQYMLNCSRFAHYIKCIMRDKIGTFSTKLEIQAFLNEWIKEYVLSMDEASQEMKAKYPLREASIIVEDVPGVPGTYDSIIFLRPHFQTEGLTVSLRLVARIPGGE